MIGVNVKEVKSFERALKIFREKIKNAKMIAQYHDNMRYEKPSVTKRKDKNKAIYLQKLRNIDNND